MRIANDKTRCLLKELFSKLKPIIMKQKIQNLNENANILDTSFVSKNRHILAKELELVGQLGYNFIISKVTHLN